MAGSSRRSAEDSKAAILEVAERYLAKGGPAAVRVQRIAADLGLTDAAVHYHFGNRENLLAALLHSAGRKLKRQFQNPPAEVAEESLLETMTDRLDDTYRRKGYARLAMWMALEGWRSQGSGMFLPMVERLHEIRPKGARRDETVMAVAALNVFMMGEALAGEEMRAGTGLPNDGESRDAMRRFVCALLAERLGVAGPVPGKSKRARVQAKKTRCRSSG
jgi:AcrR family transcriptional regulator